MIYKVRNDPINHDCGINTQKVIYLLTSLLRFSFAINALISAELSTDSSAILSTDTSPPTRAAAAPRAARPLLHHHLSTIPVDPQVLQTPANFAMRSFRCAQLERSKRRGSRVALAGPIIPRTGRRPLPHSVT